MWHNPNVRCIMIQAKYPNVKWHNEEQTEVEIIIKKQFEGLIIELNIITKKIIWI